MANANTERQQSKKVIIDAGHGGMDGGAVGVDGIVEKDINLAIALKLRDQLLINGYEVILTRDSDTSLHDADKSSVREQKISDIKNRMKMIEANEDAIFLSIHQNQFGISKDVYKRQGDPPYPYLCFDRWRNDRQSTVCIVSI